MITTRKIGEFNIESGTVLVTDPCYTLDTWFLAIIEGVAKGKWEAYVAKANCGEWGIRNAELMVHHVDFLNMGSEFLESLEWEIIDDIIGVDSGQAGFFDKKYYQDIDSVEYIPNKTKYWTKFYETDDWYYQCCELTLGEKQCGVIPYGVVSASGFGDGTYDAFIAVHPDTDEIIAMKIVFITEEEVEGN